MHERSLAGQRLPQLSGALLPGSGADQRRTVQQLLHAEQRLRVRRLSQRTAGFRELRE